MFDRSTLQVTVPSGEPGAVSEVLVETRDTRGRPFTGEVSGLAMEVRGANAGAATSVSDRGDGTHVLSYTPTSRGMDTVAVTLDGESAGGGPFVSWVRIVFRAAEGTAAIDGTMGPGEWDDATAYTVFAGPLAGSTARFLVDASDIYVVLRVPDPDLAAGGRASIRFDDTLDHVLSGDDAVTFSSASGFRDQHFEENLATDQRADGSGAATSEGGWSVVELRHPLSSGDGEDMDVTGAEGVGLCLIYASPLSYADIHTTTPLRCNLLVNQQVDYAELLLPS